MKFNMQELHDMRKRFLISLILTLPVFFIGMLDMNGDLQSPWFGVSATRWLQLALSTPVVFLCGWPIFQRGWVSMKNRSLDMFTLVVVGVSVAYWYSVTVTLVPHVTMELVQDRLGSGGVYFESAVVTTTLVLLGQYLELKSRSRTSSAIAGLLALTPSIASLIRPDGATVDLDIASVNPGDALQIRRRDKVAVDAWLSKAQSIVDESMLTGEPALKRTGDEVTAGVVNQTGALIKKTETVGRDTLLAHIIEMVAATQRSQAPVQRLVDRISAYFVPSIFAIAAFTFFTWLWLGPQPALPFALMNAVAVLIIACPCALGLATAMSVVVATEKGAANGVLIKNADSLEKMSKAVYLVIDKTGTITEGKPKLVSIVPTATLDEFEILSLAAAIEKQSDHPLAQAMIMKAASEKTVEPINIDSFQSLTGKGVRARVAEEDVCLGNELLMLDAGVDIDAQTDQAQALRSEGQTVVYLSINANCVALLGMVDPIRPSANQALRDLRAEGMKIVMMTGDNERTAQAITKQIQLDDVKAGLLPTDKANYVKSLRNAGHIVAMVGDGIIDAPALAEANIGLAMGTGIDIAMNCAGIILVKGGLNGIVRARLLSKSMMSNIQQNLILAFAYNVIAIPLAAGFLYPSLHLLLNPMIASTAMGLSSFSVVANALRLRLVKL